MRTLTLWLFVINLGVAFGAGVYEHRIVVPRWIDASGTEPRWRADLAMQDDTGRRFWAFATTVPLTLLTLASLYFAWNATGPLRPWWLAAAILASADRLVTFAYFIPTMIRLMQLDDAPGSGAEAVRWSSFNNARHLLVLSAWLASLRALTLYRPDNPSS